MTIEMDSIPVGKGLFQRVADAGGGGDAGGLLRGPLLPELLEFVLEGCIYFFAGDLVSSFGNVFPVQDGELVLKLELNKRLPLCGESSLLCLLVENEVRAFLCVDFPNEIELF